MSRLWDASIDLRRRSWDVAEKQKLVEKALTPESPFNSMSFVIRGGDAFDPYLISSSFEVA